MPPVRFCFSAFKGITVDKDRKHTAIDIGVIGDSLYIFVGQIRGIEFLGPRHNSYSLSDLGQFIAARRLKHP